jgi:hypothetical protein
MSGTIYERVFAEIRGVEYSDTINAGQPKVAPHFELLTCMQFLNLYNRYMIQSKHLVIAFTSLFIFVFSLISIGYAAEQKQKPIWGVTAHGSELDKAREQMIQYVGVDTVITARFQAAYNRLNILDQRIFMLLSKTANTCPQKVTATKTLDSATKTLATVDTSKLVVPDGTTTNLIIDTTAVTDIKTALDQSLTDLKSTITTLSFCPQYQEVKVIESIKK